MSDPFDSAVVLMMPTIVKAREPTSDGRRIVEVQASTEEVDLDGDVILQSALMGSAASFVQNGHLDLDHYSEFGQRLGIPDPASYILGRPLEVKALSGNRTSVVGEIRKSIDGKVDTFRNRYDDFWESLRSSPPVQWYSSVYGYPKPGMVDDCSEEMCQLGATRLLIRGFDWRSLAFTRNPKNTALTGAAKIVMAKSFTANLAHDIGTRGNILNITRHHHMSMVANRVAQPTPAQAAAGNYAMGHAIVGGLHVAIETPQGGTRSGVGADGVPWSVVMPANYGYVKRTKGADGDSVDVYIGSQAHRAELLPVWVIDQISDDGSFDEHKAMLGFPDQQTVLETYYNAFSDGRGPERVGAVTELSFNGFRDWLDRGNTVEPLSYTMPMAVAKTAVTTPPSPETYLPDGINALTKACSNCGIHEVPSLAGYRRHFSTCHGSSPAHADIYAHAAMHKHMMDSITTPSFTLPSADVTHA